MQSVQSDVVKLLLERIIDSRQFCNSPRLSRFLSYVVEETLEGRMDRLKGYTIGLEVFDKPDDFDPQTDTIVRVQARALRRKLDQYYAQDGAQDPVRISIAKGSYEPKFEQFWDVKPQIKEIASSNVQPTRKPSIAVLPFDDFSQNGSHEFYSLGLTEEIIADLSRFKELSVFSRSTTQKAKSEGLSVKQMREKFLPDFILEGSFRTDDETVSVTVNLVEASEDKVILVDTFKHQMSPAALYGMQDEIAELIASRISDQFGPIGQFAKRARRVGQSTKWETIDWIYRYHRKGIELSHAERIEIKTGLETAIAQDSNSSDAHAVLALLLLDEYRLEIGDRPANTLDLALARAHRAVERDNESAMAYCSMAVAQFHRGEFASFHRAADHALKLNPGHADMMAVLGTCYATHGEAQRALPLLDKAILLSPLHPDWYHLIRAIALMQTQGAEVALAEMRIAPLPRKSFYRCHLIWMLVEAGELDAAHQEKKALLKLWPEFENTIAASYRIWGVGGDMKNRAFAAWASVGLNVTE